MKIITIIYFLIFILGCSTVTYYKLDPLYNENSENVKIVYSRLTSILKEDGFKSTNDFDARFYGMTEFNEKDNIEIIFMFKKIITRKGWFIFPDEIYV